MPHILTVDQFADTKLLDRIFTKAAELEAAHTNGGMPKALTGKIVATVFYEPSTRTRLSFESAALYLGAGVISVENARQTSSDVKGESLEDTIRVINCYAGLIVLRHPQAGTAQRAAQVSRVPVINGGDGGNEHPTQALLDLWTIKKELGRLENLKVVFGFDPKHSRTIRSLARLLAIFPGNQFTFISPESLRLDAQLAAEISARGVELKIQQTLEDVGKADVIYLNRLQKERFERPEEFQANRERYVLTPAHLESSRGVVLDPLPRIDEIDPAIDALPNARYFAQAQNGLFIRAALLLYALSQMQAN